VLLANTSAYAEDLRVDIDKTFVDEGSGVGFVPSVGEFVRDKVFRFGSDNDVGATYEDPDGGTFATIYVTRVGTPDPYLWFHRVLGMITKREGFSALMEPGVQPELFDAPGFDRPSGIRVTYAVRGSKLRSSGLALMAYGDRLVKIRVSSPEHDRVALEEVMNRFIAGFALPAPTGNEPLAYMVGKCGDRLEYASDATQLEPTGALGLAAALLAMNETATDPNGARIPTKVQYCFDSLTDRGHAIYRPDSSKTGYLLSYNDAGSAVIVGSGGNTVLAQLSAQKSDFAYGVSHQSPDRTQIFAPFGTLPSPEAAIDAVANSRVIASTDRDKDITMTSEVD
jgi:hypothetical protein